MSKKWDKENADKIREYKRQWYKRNREKTLEHKKIYDEAHKEEKSAYLKEYFKVRGNDQAPFYAISDRYSLEDLSVLDVYRGDCFTNTVTIRINRNFVDPDYPINVKRYIS